MRVLVVDSFDSDDPDAHVVQSAISALTAKGHQIEYLSLDQPQFAGYMTGHEHQLYESDAPLLAPETAASAELVNQVDALLFCYPTTLFGVPSRLKSWLERVMVHGVAFVFDDKRRVRPNLHHIRHLGVVTTSPHSWPATLRARDLGRRTIMRTLRLNCGPRCMRTFIRLSTGRSAAGATAHLNRRFIRWR